MTIRKICVIACLIAAPCIPGRSSIVTIAFDNGSFQIVNQLSVALTAGTSLDGDGAVLQLGYYNGASAGSNFLGVWVPLTGEGSLNTGGVVLDTTSEPFNKTSIGDANFDSSGAGTFGITVTFDTANANTSSSLPAAGVPLALRFYNNTTIAASTFFNVVSSDAWGFVSPAAPQTNAHVNMSLDESGLKWLSINGGTEFAGGQSASTAFKTTIPVPEPSAAMAAIAGLGCLLSYRRRQKR